MMDQIEGQPRAQPPGGIALPPAPSSASSGMASRAEGEPNHNVYAGLASPDQQIILDQQREIDRLNRELQRRGGPRANAAQAQVPQAYGGQPAQRQAQPQRRNANPPAVPAPGYVPQAANYQVRALPYQDHPRRNNSGSWLPFLAACTFIGGASMIYGPSLSLALRGAMVGFGLNRTKASYYQYRREDGYFVFTQGLSLLFFATQPIGVLKSLSVLCLENWIAGIGPWALVQGFRKHERLSGTLFGIGVFLVLGTALCAVNASLLRAVPGNTMSLVTNASSFVASNLPTFKHSIGNSLLSAASQVYPF